MNSSTNIRRSIPVWIAMRFFRFLIMTWIPSKLLWETDNGVLGEIRMSIEKWKVYRIDTEKDLYIDFANTYFDTCELLLLTCPEFLEVSHVYSRQCHSRFFFWLLLVSLWWMLSIAFVKKYIFMNRRRHCIHIDLLP